MAEIEMISSRNILVLMINLLFVKSGFVPKEKMKKRPMHLECIAKKFHQTSGSQPASYKGDDKLSAN